MATMIGLSNADPMPSATDPLIILLVPAIWSNFAPARAKSEIITRRADPRRQGITSRFLKKSSLSNKATARIPAHNSGHLRCVANEAMATAVITINPTKISRI